MKYVLFSLLAISFLLSGCKTSLQPATVLNDAGWYNIIVAEGIDIYVDTANIRHEGNIAYAREKRVFVLDESKEKYVERIRNEYIKMGKPEKADKWNDFSYCIYDCMYECTNKRFRVLSVEDYNSKGELIIKTKASNKNVRWLNVESETVGDYTFFFVCDYGTEN